MCVSVGGIISFHGSLKNWKTTYRRTTVFVVSFLILLVRETIFVGWGSPFLIMLVPRYKLSLCHTSIKPDLLGFPGIDVFACGLRDHVITRFTSRHDVHSRKGNEVKRSTKWVFSSPNESVTETFNDDDIVNYGRKSCTRSNII
jgi:hypothetical protein